MLRVLVGAALLFVAQAQAAPLSMTWQGRLVDAGGAPIHDEVTLVAELFDVPVDGTVQWSDSFVTNVDGGFFSIELGAGSALPIELFAGGDVYVQVRVDGQVMGERRKLTSVPFALVSAGVSVEATTPDLSTCTDTGAMVYDTAAEGLRLCTGSEWVWVQGGSGLEASGPIKLGDGGTCAAAADAGQIRWHDGSLEVCDGAGWDDIRHNDTGSVLYSHYETDNTSRNFGTSWAVGTTWSTHSLPGDTKVMVVGHVPGRNDTAGWGGCYTEYQVNINGTGWVSLGDSGFDMMAEQSDVIDSMNYSFIYDPGQSEDYTIQFRNRHRSYSATCKINGSHDITGGSVGFGFTNMTVLAIAK